MANSFNDDYGMVLGRTLELLHSSASELKFAGRLQA